MSHHKHARTRSGSSHQPRKESLTADMPLVNIQTSTTINSGRESIAKTTTTKLVTAKNSTGVNRSGASSVLRDYLFHKSSNIFRSLMRSGVGVVQRSMDAFEGVSSKVRLLKHDKEILNCKNPLRNAYFLYFFSLFHKLE